MSALTAPPLSVYVHWPWCVRKCPYCDFNSHRRPAKLPDALYVERLLDDLRHDLQWVENRVVQSVFFGGGTPSLFPPEAFHRFLEGLRALIAVAPDAEVTLEANPGTLECGCFAGYRAAGINRISLGVQSFNDRQLNLIGRIHSSQQALEAIGEIRQAGFNNFNLDLMYGLPDQSLDAALHDTRMAIELAPAHISHYQLTLEPGTAFHRRPPKLPDDEAIWEMMQTCQGELAAAGYQQYEVSAYAQPGRMCWHNRNYWSFGDYVGLGAGAHGKFTDASGGRIFRTERVRQPREYLARESATMRVFVQPVPQDALPFEFMLNALRLNEGFTAQLFESRTGLPMNRIQPQLKEAMQRGLLEQTLMGWRASELGRRFLNDLQALFLPASISDSLQSARAGR